MELFWLNSWPRACGQKEHHPPGFTNAGGVKTGHYFSSGLPFSSPPLMWIHLSCHRVQWSRMIFFLLGFSPEFDNSSPFGFKISENIYKPENVQPCSWWWGTKASNLLSLQPWQAVAGIPLFQIFTATWWKINLPHGKERKHQRSVNKSAWQILIQYLNAAEAHKIDSLPLMSKRNHVLCWIFFFLYFATFSVCGSGENKSFKFTKLHHYRRCRFHKTVCRQECLFLIN